MATFARAFQCIFIILAVHAAAILAGWYDHDSLFDVPMHFAGGAAMAYLALAAWNASIDQIVFRASLKPVWRALVYAVAILGFVALVGVAWEWYEFSFDYLVSAFGFDLGRAQMGIADTMIDLFLDLLGGLTIFSLFRKRSDI